MKNLRSTILPVFIAWIWISLCEFGRNQLWLISIWTKHYENMGLQFPTEPVNGAVWGLWALVFAILIAIISKRFSIWESTAITWSFSFVLMWLVIGNMKVLPVEILIYAIPLSLIETWGANWIIMSLRDRLNR